MKRKSKGHRQIDIREAARAIVCATNGQDKDTQLWAFLSVFHPNLTHQQKVALTRKEP